MNYYHLFGDFECLKAAVQNGADSVYLGASSFSARASATNFDLDELKEAIKYARLRNVDVHLTLNTLLQENEICNALEIANTAYSYGVSAIIVQDFGLANLLIKNFPDLPIHASTQMTIHNLDSVKALEKIGFKRVVLSRELNLDEIEYICKNSNIEIEAFIHGALCISYSGRCYISSLIGGRSGNRGKCAQACRLPYTLYNDKNQIDNGYILSPRDLCSLEYLPQLVNAGVSSFKIEGRMKTPEYVATVTRIYRKYLDIIKNKQDYSVSSNDLKELMQVFNRGGFSTGHLSDKENKKLIYPVKPNNIGLYLGKVKKINSNKGLITICPEENIEIGDTVTFENEKTKYTISELTKNNQNLKNAHNEIVQIGRMKGNIHVGDKVYRLESKTLSKIAEDSYKKENKKILLNAKIIIQKDTPIKFEVIPLDNSIYSGLQIEIDSDIIPEIAKNQPLTIEKIKEQICKTGNTQFDFENIDIELGNNLYIPKISSLNEIRRNALSKLESMAIERITRGKKDLHISKTDISSNNCKNKISLLLNNINLNYDYTKIKGADYVYIPLSYYMDTKYKDKIIEFEKTYIYLPNIIRKSNVDYIKNAINKIIQSFPIEGIVISNLGDLDLLPKEHNLKLVANYTFNVFNTYTKNELEKLGFDRITIAFELPKHSISNVETIVYGRAPVMTLNYCLLGKSNKCYKECPRFCDNGSYFLRDRMNFDFPIKVHNAITTIYNSKITSIPPTSLNRIDILNETVDEINNIISTVLSGKRLEGKDYTNANLNREI